MRTYKNANGLAVVTWPGDGTAYGDANALSEAYLSSYEALYLEGRSWWAVPTKDRLSYGQIKRRVRLVEVKMEGARVHSMVFEKVLAGKQ